MQEEIKEPPGLNAQNTALKGFTGTVYATYLANGSTVQRWLCRECTYRFSQPRSNKPDKPQRVETVDTLILKSEDAKFYNGCGSEGSAVSELRKLKPQTTAKALEGQIRPAEVPS